MLRKLGRSHGACPVECHVAMAFGARRIIHACYHKGWWHEKTTPVCTKGRKNVTYDYVRRINAQMADLWPAVCSYQPLGVRVHGSLDPSDLMYESFVRQNKRMQPVLKGSDESVFEIDASGAVIAGYFEHYKEQNKKAVLIANGHYDDRPNRTKDVRIISRCGTQVRVFADRIRMDTGNLECVQKISLGPGEGVWIEYTDCIDRTDA